MQKAGREHAVGRPYIIVYYREDGSVGVKPLDDPLAVQDAIKEFEEKGTVSFKSRPPLPVMHIYVTRVLRRFFNEKMLHEGDEHGTQESSETC